MASNRSHALPFLSSSHACPPCRARLRKLLPRRSRIQQRSQASRISVRFLKQTAKDARAFEIFASIPAAKGNKIIENSKARRIGPGPTGSPGNGCHLPPWRRRVDPAASRPARHRPGSGIERQRPDTSHIGHIDLFSGSRSRPLPPAACADLRASCEIRQPSAIDAFAAADPQSLRWLRISATSSVAKTINTWCQEVRSEFHAFCDQPMYGARAPSRRLWT